MLHLPRLAAATATAVALLVTADPPVQPESLPQGFIVVVTDKSGVATADSPVYLASSHNGWNPGDQAQRLTPRSDRRWQIVVPKPKLDSRMAFKFTRGNWDTVEVDAGFNDIENRALPLIDPSKLAQGEQPVIELTIEAWHDRKPGNAATSADNPYREIKVSAGTIRRVEVTGGGVPITRDLLVWLPPGYDDPENERRTYPVLYMQDGQNLFDKHPGIPGEWEMDETASRLIAAGTIEPLIIVGIPNAGSGAARGSEYLPVDACDQFPPKGDAYVQFLLAEVKPRIDRAFRTRRGPENAAIGGSSLGAIISLYAATRHPEAFGKVLAESPPLLAKDKKLMRLFEQAPKWPAKVYIGMGGKEAGEDPKNAAVNDQHAQSAKDLEAILHAKGLSTDDVKTVIDPSAVHNEPAWAKRLPEALTFLFPAQKQAP